MKTGKRIGAWLLTLALALGGLLPFAPAVRAAQGDVVTGATLTCGVFDAIYDSEWGIDYEGYDQNSGSMIDIDSENVTVAIGKNYQAGSKVLRVNSDIGINQWTVYENHALRENNSRECVNYTTESKAKDGVFVIEGIGSVTFAVYDFSADKYVFVKINVVEELQGNDPQPNDLIVKYGVYTGYYNDTSAATQIPSEAGYMHAVVGEDFPPQWDSKWRYFVVNFSEDVTYTFDNWEGILQDDGDVPYNEEWNGNEKKNIGIHILDTGTFTLHVNHKGTAYTYTVIVEKTLTSDPAPQPAHNAEDIYLLLDDGNRIYAENGEISLDVLNKGTFRLHGEDDAAAGIQVTKWTSEEYYTVNAGNNEKAWHFWISNGRFNPRGLTDGQEAKVSYTVNGAAKEQTFQIVVVESGITELKVYHGNQELGTNEALEIQGSEWAKLTVKGRASANDDFTTIDPQAWVIADQESVHIQGDSFTLWQAEKDFTLTVSMKDNPNVKAEFKVKSKYVPVTDFTIDMPSPWDIELWNGEGHYIGISERDEDNNSGQGGITPLPKGYVVRITPENASNHALVWEALTPEIAYFDELHSNGVVPIKAGTARFLVRSADKPEVSKTVEVVFRFKNPLTGASAQDLNIPAPGDEVELVLTLTPDDATEQRFAWSFDKPGIVTITDKVELPANGIGAHTTKHVVKGLKDGTVIVTGTPFDTSGGAQPVSFKVTVGNGGSSGGNSGGGNTGGGNGGDIDTPVAPAPASRFIDVKAGAWYENAVNYVVEKDLMAGTAADRFSPDLSASRAMLVTILYALEGKPAVSGDNPFDDVDEDAWYRDAVLWGADKGIITGYGNGKFGPDDLITREQFAVTIYNYANIKGYDTKKTADLGAYDDASDISTWAVTAMKWTNAAGLITGRTTKTLVPKGNTTRAEMAVILMQFIENVR